MGAEVLTPAPVDRTALAPPRLGGWRELARYGPASLCQSKAHIVPW